MRFVVYLDREGTKWPPPEHAPGEPVIIDTDPGNRLDDVAVQAIKTMPRQLQGLYQIAGGGPYFSPVALRDAKAPNPELLPFPRVVIDENGEFLWTDGARDRVILADIQRTHDAGFFEGDPGGVFLERPMFGEAPLGWDDFLQWLIEFAFLFGVGEFVAFIRRKYEHWRNRGAATPFAFLDIVVAREEWDRQQLSQLLGLTEQEASELLTSMGFEPSQSDPNQWAASDNPETSALRKKIIHDFLHRPKQEDEGE